MKGSGKIDEDTVIIKRAANGLVIKYTDVNGITEQPMINRVVLEEMEHAQNDEQRDAELAQKLCYWLIDYFGWSGSKHDSHRIRITIERNGD